MKKKRYIGVFPSPWLLTPEALEYAVEHNGMVLITFEIGFFHEGLTIFKRAHSIFPSFKAKTVKNLDERFTVMHLHHLPLMNVVDADKLQLVQG